MLPLADATAVLGSFSSGLVDVADGMTASSYARVLRPQSVSHQEGRRDLAVQLNRVTPGIVGLRARNLLATMSHVQAIRVQGV